MYTLIMRCPKCLWHDNCRICPICNQQTPLKKKNIKEGLTHCHDCDGIKYRNLKTSKIITYSPSNETRSQEED